MSTRSNFYIPLALLLTLILSNSAIAQNEKKIAYGILVDNTGSLRTQFSQVKMLGKGVVQHIHQGGSISLFDFMNQRNKKNSLAVVTSGVAWSQDKNAYENRASLMSD